MKQGWKIKKLGDVATYVNGYAFKPEHWVESGTPIIRIQNLNNPDAPYNYCNFDIPSKYIVERGDILISWSASLGVYEWGHDNGYLNQHIFKVVFDKGDINKYYLKYAVSTKISDMLENLHGATMKHIVKKDFDNTLIPVPPIAEQEKIVAELDCLSGIIEKKKQQLKELDALAQSIFYEMFGDPVENDKGWEKKRLGDLADISSSKRIFANEYTEIGVPFYRGKEVTEKSKGNEISVELYISEDRYNEIKGAYGVPVVGDILVTAVGTIGNIWVVDSEEPFYFKDGNVLWMKIKNNSHPVYFQYLLSVLIDEYKEQMANGCAYSALTIVNLKEMPTTIVPLTLQQEFASKIESIEKQKELIAQSIKETETLFNSRMDYYFN